MSKRYPREFRDDVVRVALARDPGVPLARIAADFGVGKSSLQNWIREATQNGDRVADCDRHLDRADLSPPAAAGPSGAIDPGGVRDLHDHSGRTGGLSLTVTYSCSRPVFCRSRASPTRAASRVPPRSTGSGPSGEGWSTP